MTYHFLSATDPGWDEALGRFPPSMRHVHFTAAYHRVLSANGDGVPRLFVAEDNSGLFFYPFMLRPIPSIDGTTHQGHLNDAASVFGYTGPLLFTSCTHFRSVACAALANHLRELHCIAELVRFNPLLANHLAWDQTTYRLSFVKPYVVMLLDEASAMLPRYHGRLAEYVRQGERLFGDVIASSTDRTCLSAFYLLYQKHMSAIGADTYYHFSEPYFNALSDLVETSGRLFYVQQQGQMIAGLLFLHSHGFAYYHHGARDTDHPQSGLANKYLFHKAFEHYHSAGVTLCLLGGGVGNGPDDSLLRFKQSYGGGTVPFVLGKRIIRNDDYQAISALWQHTFPHLATIYAGHIDKYRFRS